MKTKICLLIIAGLIVSLIISGCEQKCDNSIPDDLLTAIDNFYSAIENNDYEKRINMFTDKALMLPNHWTPYIGIENISQVIKAGENAVFKIRDREIIEIDQSGDLAYTVNSYYYTYHAIDDEPQWHKTKNVHLWKKVASGEWKLHLDIWNSDVPISQFPIE